MRLADTGGSGLSNGTKETPLGLPGGQGSLLDVLAKDKCASVRKGNVSEDVCATLCLSQMEPPAHTSPEHSTPSRAVHDYRLHFFGWRDCEMSEGTSGRFLTHIQ